MKRPRPPLAHAHARALVALALLAPARAAHAAPGAPAGEAARAHFARGVALFQEGEHRAALVEFRRAYDASPNFRVQYNVARTCLELKDEPCALGAFERYLADGAGRLDAARRAEVERDLARLRLRVGYVEVSVEANGAEVTIDDEPVGTSPLPAAVPVGAGRHRVAAALPSGRSAARVVEIAGGERLRVDLNVPAPLPAHQPPAAAAPAPPRPAAPAPPAPAPPRRTGLWVGVAATGALAAGSAVAGYLAARQHDGLEAALRSPSPDLHEVESHRSQGRTLALVADVAAVAAVAAGAVTLYVALTPARPSTPTGRTGAPPAVGLRLGPGSVGLHYAF